MLGSGVDAKKRTRPKPGSLYAFDSLHSALAALPGVLLTALSRLATWLSGISLTALSRLGWLSGIPLTALSRFAARLPGILLPPSCCPGAVRCLALLLVLDFLSVFLHHFLHRQSTRILRLRSDPKNGDVRPHLPPMTLGGGTDTAKRREY